MCKSLFKTNQGNLKCIPTLQELKPRREGGTGIQLESLLILGSARQSPYPVYFFFYLSVPLIVRLLSSVFTLECKLQESHPPLYLTSRVFPGAWWTQ